MHVIKSTQFYAYLYKYMQSIFNVWPFLEVNVSVLILYYICIPRFNAINCNTFNDFI